MSLQGTFSTATLSLHAQAQHLTNIATNIANVQTNAYKVQRTNFQTLLNHASLNQTFFAADTVDTRAVDKQGRIVTTQRALDLAIDGRGLFVTNELPDGSGEFQFTRDGSFAANSITFETDTDGDGLNDQGAVLTTTAGNTVFGWPANADGTFDEVNDLTALQAVTINSNQVQQSTPTANITLQANVSDEDSGRQDVGLPFIDADGNRRTLTVGFTVSEKNTYTLDAASRNLDNEVVTATIEPAIASFDGFGNLEAPTDGILTITINDAAGPQVISLDISQTTQLAANGSIEIMNYTQDGLLEGRLTRTYFDSAGILYGSFTNRAAVPLFKLPMATFQAPNNLEAMNGNYFRADAEAGEMELRALGSVSGLAQIIVEALEQSNVDVGDQFTKMIITQRAYSSSATVLRTADEMTQQARDLKR